MMKRELDCIVIGAGPAGAALGAALLRRGLDVACVDPQAKWTPTYGVWPDELADLPYDIPYANVWDNVSVTFGDGIEQVIQRPYARVDADRLSSAFFDLLRSRDALISGRVSDVRFSPPFFSVEIAGLGVLRSRFVFDAAGHKARFVHRPMGRCAAQTAYGKTIETGIGASTLSSKTMGLMRWHDGLEVGAESGRVPAFVYVMPLSDEIAFVEMTVLAARPAVNIEELRKLLDRWLDERGLNHPVDGAPEERVFIPMGHELPSLDQPIVGIGGAASEVHPATGYMLTRTLHTAERLADAVSDYRRSTAESAKKQLWRAVWTPEEVRARALYRFGLEATLAMGPEQTREFFQAFFELPAPRWRGYLSGALDSGELAEVMWMLFREVSPGLKLRLARSALGRSTPRLARAILG